MKCARNKYVVFFVVLTGYWLLVTGYCFSAAFDDISVTARGKGMGGAFTAGADDYSAVYWNPSALSRIRKPELGLSYRDLYGLGLLNYSFVSYVQPGVGKGAVGFGWIRMGTTPSVGFMNYAENTIIFSYGQRIKQKFLFGVSVKYFSVAYDVKASGIGFDMAGTYLVNDRVRIAVMWYNLNNPIIRWETLAVDSIPSTLKVGTRLEFVRNNALNIDIKRKMGKQAEPSFGWEGWFMDKAIGLRAGAARQDEKLNTAYGMSVKYQNIRFDYSLEKHYSLGFSSDFSLSYGF